MDGIAARYAYHRLVAHRYAVGVASGAMSLDEAHEHYRRAMENYDGIVANAKNGQPQAANIEDMDKGAAVIDEMVSTFGVQKPAAETDEASESTTGGVDNG